eukprot:CAMPEP_0177726136 /NCGR_PEP_ID=MMETSP0484_2-20121128/19617_1 /TAXON_ID=354590 /ORGANISM="Rhodomonas lens, Strain RHODO" /LENGTH=264 /DNA_ID=CAMNT_0019238683 /DNA_START=59 /DNA_END=854 /DNA_ORIENTATION=+
MRNAVHNKVMCSGLCPRTERAWQEQHGRIPAGDAPHQFEADADSESDSEGARAGLGERCGARTRHGRRLGEGVVPVLVALENAPSVLNVLHRHALPANATRGTKLLTYDPHPLATLEEEGHAQTHWEVRLRADFDAHLGADANMVFVLRSCDGYLVDGIEYVVELLDHELDEILEQAIELNEVLFALYLGVTVTDDGARAERGAERAHAGAPDPAAVLTGPEVKRIADFFHDDDDDKDDAAGGQSESCAAQPEPEPASVGGSRD